MWRQVRFLLLIFPFRHKHSRFEYNIFSCFLQSAENKLSKFFMIVNIFRLRQGAFPARGSFLEKEPKSARW